MAPNKQRKSNSGRSDRQRSYNPQQQSRSKNNKNQSTRRNNTQKRHYGCGICQADHSLSACKKFLKLNLAEKYKTAVRLHYCVNCLARNHLIAKCTNKARCTKCNGKHHTLLHGPARILKDITEDASSNREEKETPTPAPRRSLVTTSSTSIVQTAMTRTFVPTLMVQVVMNKGKQSVRAVLNPSQTKSKISSSFVHNSWLKAFTIDDQVYVKAIIAPYADPNTQFELCMEVVRDLPRKPYACDLDEAIKNKVQRITLADPDFTRNTPIDIEIGGDLYTTILQPNIIHIDGGSLMIQDSTFGWLVMGSITH